MKIFAQILCYFSTIYRNYLNKSCIFFKDLLPYIISGPYTKWQ